MHNLITKGLTPRLLLAQMHKNVDTVTGLRETEYGLVAFENVATKSWHEHTNKLTSSPAV